MADKKLIWIKRGQKKSDNCGGRRFCSAIYFICLALNGWFYARRNAYIQNPYDLNCCEPVIQIAAMLKKNNYQPPLPAGDDGSHGKGAWRHGWRQANGHGRRKVTLGMGVTIPR